MGFRTFSQIKKKRQPELEKDYRLVAAMIRYGTREGLAFFVIVVPALFFPVV